jgi:hypothetical protein
MSRETIDLTTKIAIADWLRVTEPQLLADNTSREDAYVQCKSSLGVPFNFNHFEGVRRSLNLKWGVGESRAKRGEDFKDDISMIAYHLRMVLQKQGLLPTGRLEELANQYLEKKE